MAIICPSILAADESDYRKEIEKVVQFAHRIQIDLTDGQFAPHKTVTPEEAWWPAGFRADFHLMYNDPVPAINKILQHKPHLIIIHAEAEGDFEHVSALCRNNSVKLGVALLPTTAADTIFSAIDKIDHVLIFSGELGSYGGHADVSLLEKVKELKSQRNDLEIGWDGGVNDQNISQLVFGGVDVINVGGYIQDAEHPEHAYHSLERIAEETATT